MRAPQTATIRRQLFEALAPVGIYIVSTDAPLSVTIYAKDGIGIAKRFGSNRPCRPVRIGTTTSLRDTISALFDKNPFVRTAVQGRIWLPAQGHAGRLVTEANRVLAVAAERAGYGDLRQGYVDCGPQFDAAGHEARLIELAKALGIAPAWTDDDLALFLEQAGLLARLKGIHLSNRRALADLMDRMLEKISKTAK